MKGFFTAAFLRYACGVMMTPEEQFMKIENALRHAAEIQAQQAENIARNEAAIRDLIAVSRTLLDTAKLHSEQITALDDELDNKFKSAMERMERAEEARERDREEFNANFNALLRAQLETEQKLQRWIDRQSHP